MKNWFSQLLEPMSEKGRNAARLAIIFMVAASLAVLVFAFVAIQSGAWQAYAVVAAFVGFFALEALVIRWARQGQSEKVGILLVAAVCYIVLAMAGLMAGIGLGLSVALAVVIVEIVFETLSGSLATRARILGLAFAAAMFLMDKFATWNRPSFPIVQYAIPSIAAGTVITIALLMVVRLVAWRDLNLARKLLVAFGALFIFGLVIAASGLFGLNQVQSAYENTLAGGVQVQDLSNHLNSELLEARRREKDFLLRWKDESFDIAYANYVVVNQQHTAEMKTTLQQLSELGPVLDRVSLLDYSRAQYDSDIATLNQNIVTYEESFANTVSLIQQRGFVDTGLEGEFRVAVHNIEDRTYDREGLEPLVITMLQIRRHEKDYLLRGDQSYIDQTHQAVADLKQQITTSDQLTPIEKTEMLALADKYVVAFDGLVEKDVEIAAATEVFRAAAADAQTTTERIDAAGEQLAAQDTQTAQANTRQAFIITGIAVLVVLILSVVLSFALSRLLTRPIVQLTYTAQEISAGRFDVQAEVTSGDEIGTLAQTFNSMTSQLGQAFADVRRRAAELATVAEVSTASSTILESKRLLQEVVDLTKERFNLYHSHIYLLDEEGKNLVLTAGAGEPGRVMVAEGRSIPLSREQSLVARAAREGQGVTVNDVTQASDFLPNPLLPNTRSELAVPMIVGGKVIGVFDVQSDVVGRFTDSDINIQTTLAAQVATSIQNVRSFEQSKIQADFEALVNTIGQKIQRATTVEETLQTAIRELGSALGATRVRASIGAGQQANGNESNRN